MQSVKLTSLLRIFSSPLFKENFSKIDHRYSEICTDELNRQVLQIDFTTTFDYPMYGADLAELGIAITDFLNDKNHPALFGSCTYNGINRLYYRAFVNQKRYISDPEVSSKQKRGNQKRSENAVTPVKPLPSEEKPAVSQPKADVVQSEHKSETPAFVDIIKRSKRPGDKRGLDFVPSSQKEEVVVAPPPPIEMPKPDPQLRSKFDTLTIKAFALEQEVANLKNSIIDKEAEIKKLVEKAPPQVKRVKISELPPEDRSNVRHFITNNRPPIASEKKFVQYFIGRTAEEIAYETFYTCEYYGLNDDGLAGIHHLIDNLIFHETAEENARLCYSLVLPNLKFLKRREEEMSRRGRR